MTQERIGNRILELRRIRKITLPELAEKLEIDTDTILSWENGLSYPEIPMLPKLASILETSIDYLVQGNVPKIQKLFVGSTEPINQYSGETLMDQINRHYLEKGWKISHSNIVDGKKTVILVVLER